jgi:C4-dicarboxylate transporter DctQ subunit
LAVILALIYCGLIIYGSWIYLAKMQKIGLTMEDLPVPVWLANGMLLVGFVFLSIRLLMILWAVIVGKMDGFKIADEAKDSMELAEEIIKGGESK